MSWCICWHFLPNYMIVFRQGIPSWKIMVCITWPPIKSNKKLKIILTVLTRSGYLWKIKMGTLYHPTLKRKSFIMNWWLLWSLLGSLLVRLPWRCLAPPAGILLMKAMRKQRGGAKAKAVDFSMLITVIFLMNSAINTIQHSGSTRDYFATVITVHLGCAGLIHFQGHAR